MSRLFSIKLQHSKVLKSLSDCFFFFLCYMRYFVTFRTLVIIIPFVKSTFILYLSYIKTSNMYPVLLQNIFCNFTICGLSLLYNMMVRFIIDVHILVDIFHTQQDARLHVLCIREHVHTAAFYWHISIFFEYFQVACQ